jgi:hypothetical protein
MSPLGKVNQLQIMPIDGLKSDNKSRKNAICINDDDFMLDPTHDEKN